MDLAGSPFYTSGTFWAGAGTVAGLLGTVAIVWVTVRVASPKRRLYYSMPVVTSMLNRRPDLSRELKVIYGEKQLDCPHVVNVELASKGRFDIPREAFDGGEPLCLDIGAPITECLKVATSPTGRVVPAYKIDGSGLLIGPCLIGKRQTIVFSLLVDGPSPRLSLPSQSLVDVDIRPKDAGYGSAVIRRLVAAICLLVILFVAETIVTTHIRPTPITASIVSASLTVALIIVGAVLYSAARQLCRSVTCVLTGRERTRCDGSGQAPAEDQAVASWLPILRGLTPHGLRHGLQTWMDEDGIPEVLKAELMGHEMPGMHGVYGHVSPAMRAELKAALQERWLYSLVQRARLAPRSCVPFLDRLLGGERPAATVVCSKLASKTRERRIL